MGCFGKNSGDIDTLVLGCTHYVFAAPQLRALLGENVNLVDTGVPVARQTRRLLEAEQQLAGAGAGQLQLLGSGAAQQLQAAAVCWLPGLDKKGPEAGFLPL